MISIHIEAHPDRGDLKDQVDRSLAAIGFSRQATLSAKVDEVIAAAPLPMPAPSDMSADKSVKGDNAAQGGQPATVTEEKPAPKPRGRAKADKPVETPPAPEPEVAAQDDADEIAEVEADQPADEPEAFTLDTVRHAMGDYVRAFGAEFAQADIPALIGAPKVSAIPNTPEALQAATLAVRAAVANNPNGRAAAGGAS